MNLCPCFGLNRTILELKSVIVSDCTVAILRLNRTILELKYYWSHGYIIFRTCLNRTILELKSNPTGGQGDT